MARGGMRKGAGRPKNWGEKMYPLPIMRLPEELKATLLLARDKKVPVNKLIEAIRQAA